MEEKHEEFYKFPRTRHVIDTGGGVGRDDLLMDARDMKQFLSNHLSIEEKIDGANLGISLTQDYHITFQNRSHYVTSATSQQWKALDSWLQQHPAIFQVLTPDMIIYGEWMYAKHSIHYTALPDYFVAFDIWDKKSQQFYSRKERDRLLEGTGIHTIPLIAEGKFKKDDLLALLQTRSRFYDGPVEGIYIRVDEGNYLKDRAKIVRHDFLQTNSEGEVEHWSKGNMIRNIVKFG